jgi:hypothetical protein
MDEGRMMMITIMMMMMMMCVCVCVGCVAAMCPGRLTSVTTSRTEIWRST